MATVGSWLEVEVDSGKTVEGAPVRRLVAQRAEGASGRLSVRQATAIAEVVPTLTLYQANIIHDSRVIPPDSLVAAGWLGVAYLLAPSKL